MLCQQCKELDAVLNLTHLVGEAVQQVHLCEKCAAERGLPTTIAMPKPTAIGDFLSSVQNQVSAMPGDAARCAYCGTSLRDFRASGRLGCAQCYGAFEQSLRDLLRRVQGNVKHMGRQYDAPTGEAMTQDAALGHLRQQLNDAISREEFESAASLRDQIRTLE
jgi:protein arginine kinase activator